MKKVKYFKLAYTTPNPSFPTQKPQLQVSKLTTRPWPTLI